LVGRVSYCRHEHATEGDRGWSARRRFRRCLRLCSARLCSALVPERQRKGIGVARLKLHAAKVLVLAGLLVAGVGASAALADPGSPGGGPPPTVPGSPGDNCSHGNSDQDCRPDPNQNGQDCQDHGNASGNEDHCDAVDTTTTTSTTETTTTSTTTTSSTTTNPTTTSSGSPGTPPPGNGEPPSSSSGGPESSSASTPPVTKPELQKQLADQAKGVHAAQAASAPSKPGELPFTGFPAWAIALIGSGMLLTGLGLRRTPS
jgi:hypothetical protein